MRTIAIIQARMSSTRLPAKIMLDLNGKPVLQNIIERLSYAKSLDEVVVATSSDLSDDKVEDLCRRHNYKYYRGSLYDVLDRFYVCAREYNADTIVRCTADNALIDPSIVDQAIEYYTSHNYDYIYYRAGLPLGMCIEVFSIEALSKSYREAKDAECREHVTPYIRNNKDLFNALTVECMGTDYSTLRFTMDTVEDYEFVKHIYDYFADNTFTYDQIITVLAQNPQWLSINSIVMQKAVSYKGENSIQR